jgi:20S proteasome alpha/beta subunit
MLIAYWFVCLKILVDRLGQYVQVYTLYSSVRPFGISTILAAVDKDGPSLYVVEPSGVFYVREILDVTVFVFICLRTGL